MPAEPPLALLFFHEGKTDGMVQGEYSAIDCQTEQEVGPANVAFDPWVSLGEGRDWVVTSANGLIGRVGGYDPTGASPVENKWDWVMSYEMDPLIGRDLWPLRITADDDQLSDEERALLEGTVLDSPYIIKLGILGPSRWRCFFGEMMEESDFQEPRGGWMQDFNPTEPIPVTVKIVTGRGDLFKVQEFDVDLSVPNMQARCDVYANFPEFYSPLSLPENSGTIPTGNESQYETALFEVDPWNGGKRIESPGSQPWGLGT